MSLYLVAVLQGGAEQSIPGSPGAFGLWPYRQLPPPGPRPAPSAGELQGLFPRQGGARAGWHRARAAPGPEPRPAPCPSGRSRPPRPAGLPRLGQRSAGL